MTLADFMPRPASREARNEQVKLTAAYVNAVAIALLVTAVAGSVLNPALEATLTLEGRATMAFLSLMAHIIARRVLRLVEDR
jgi:hypothetical protein